MADAQIVYGSPTSLYIATQKWVTPTLSLDQLPPSQVTVIDKFDVSDPDTTTYLVERRGARATCSTSSRSPRTAGYLRVASTSRPIWWGTGPADDQPELRDGASAAGRRPRARRPGIGPRRRASRSTRCGSSATPGTSSPSTRSTRSTRSTSAPRRRRRWSVSSSSRGTPPISIRSPTGCCSGSARTSRPTTNEPTGAQLELFDVADPASPKLLAKTSLGTGSSSQATYDHHAFLYWAATNLVVLPVQVYSYQVVTPGIVPSSTARRAVHRRLAFRVTRSGIQQLAPARRRTRSTARRRRSSARSWSGTASTPSRARA